MKKLLLIDGNAILHRAYHALPPLTNTKGMVVNGVYGFFSMLFNVLIDQKPDYLAVCFDRAAPNFRQTLFAGYQQHRPAMADDFVPQIILVHELLEKMKVSVFELDGYEADDLIGTIATLAVSRRGPVGRFPRPTSSVAKLPVGARRGSPTPATPPISDLEVIILTGDRDMLQLVNERVKILMPLVGISKTILFDEGKVEEKYGVKPSQFIDYKALIGDASDGYPGVAGIGPKTASNLLKEYETFENLYKQIPKLPERVGLKLATDAEQAALAKKLATIVIDVPTQFDIQKCACSGFDIKSLREAFSEQGFKTLTKRLDTIFGAGEQKEIEKMKKNEKKDQLELL